MTASRQSALPRLLADQGYAVVFGEVFIVLEVEGGQRQAVGEAAGCDP